MADSSCTTSFSVCDLDPLAMGCPVRGCVSVLGQAPYNKNSTLPFCPEHGLRVHASGTFVYYNGASRQAKTTARSRSIFFNREYFAQHIVNDARKTEVHRLENENSEDVLSWNVFVGALSVGRLHKIYEWLSGDVAAEEQVKLYLWGLRIDLNCTAVEQYSPLVMVRTQLETDIAQFMTEPDVIVVGPNRLICIEAKFTGGNHLATDEDVPPGRKPKRSRDLFARYLKTPDLQTPPVLRADMFSEPMHEQLFRNFVFASCMAKSISRNWLVVNLVSSTQWIKKKRKHRDYDFSDPTSKVPCELHGQHFRFLTWEALLGEVLSIDAALQPVATYMRGKTAHLQPAFAPVA